MKRILTTILSCFILFTTISYSQRANLQLIKELNYYLEQYYQNKKIPSISAGVLKDNSILWLGNKGLADLENFVTATQNSLYRIASVTKSIVAVAVMQLYERGKISLDDEINKYVPYFPKKKWKITVRQLLNHTSGLRSYKNEDEFNSKMFYSSLKEAVSTFDNDELLFEPGTNYNYTSLGYTLLAALIENVANIPFEDYLKKNIFKPAGMKSTLVDIQSEIIFNRVNGYTKNARRDFINSPLVDLSQKVGGGGLLSNPEDLLLFAKSILDEKLIKRSTFEIMIKPTYLNNGKKSDYGLGFVIHQTNDSIYYYGHEGRGTGFSSNLIIFPENKIAAVYLINVRDRNLGDPALDIANFILKKPIPIPSKTLADHLSVVYNEFGIDSTIMALSKIESIKKNEFNFSLDEVIYFGNLLVERNKIADGIKYLKFLLRKYNNSFPVLVALAEAYYKDQNIGLAMRYFREAKKVNPGDPYVNRMLNRISKK